MKGLTHLTLGVAWVSCWPAAVAAGAEGHPGLFVLGAACGILPDTLDFRFLRYGFAHDVEVIPDPNRPDPALIAEALAAAAAQARTRGRTVRVRLHTARVGTGLWQQYRLRFDVANGEVQVTYTGIVNTSRDPVHVAGNQAEAIQSAAPLQVSLALDYRAETEIDIFDGPTFAFDPMPDGRVGVRFIPWHRQWTHSLTLAAAVGVTVGLLAGPLAGAAAGGAWTLHVLADQTGFLGSNLFYPFTRARSPGLRLAAADNPWVNIAAIWLAVLLVFWNLARQAHPPPHLPVVSLLLGAGVLPLGIAYAIARRLHRNPL